MDGVTVCQNDRRAETLRGGPFGRVRVSTGKGDVTLELWDTCGLEKVKGPPCTVLKEPVYNYHVYVFPIQYFAVGPQFMRGSNAVVFVYDISELVSSCCDV